MLRLTVFAALLCLGFSIKVKNCMKNSVVKVGHVKVHPHPIPIDKGFHINYDASIIDTIDGDITVDVTIKKKLGWIWVKVPCISQAGSCSYEDICTQMDE